MGKSSIFLATTILIGMLVLTIFVISSLPPLGRQPADANVNADQVTPLDVPTVNFGDPIRGPQAAAVTIVEFGDFQCQPCAQLDLTLAKVLQDYPRDVRLVWKDFPDESLHKQAFAAAVAARCAAAQGAFWEYHDALMADQSSIDPNNFGVFAAQLGLDQTSFESCVQDQATQPVVERDFEEGQRLRIDATPYLFVNGRRVSGAVDYQFLHDVVAAELAKAESAKPASPAPAAH